MLSVARIVFFAFAALLIVGGIMGYVEKRSVISLVAGVVCGLMALYAGMIILTRPSVACGVGIVAALLVGGSMAGRVMKSDKPMAERVFPGIVTVAASVLTLGVSVAALMAARSPAGR